MEKTIAELEDELMITNIKIFMLVDKVESPEGTLEDAKNVQRLNRYRSQLKNAINKFHGARQEVKV